jgi:hypothetical protein
VTPAARILAPIAAAAASLALSACGDGDVGDPIPAGTADRLEQRLDQIQSDVEGSRCDAIDPHVALLQRGIAALGDQGVGSDVQNALADGVDRLRTLAQERCRDRPPETPTTPTETTPPETTPPVTVPDEQPTTPTPTPAPEPVVPDEPAPTPQPDEGGGQDQFDPGQGQGDGAVGSPGQFKGKGKGHGKKRWEDDE